MKHEFFAAIYTFSLFLGMLLLLEIGRQIGIRRREEIQRKRGMVLATSLLAGYGMAGSAVRSWLHMLCFAASWRW